MATQPFSSRGGRGPVYFSFNAIATQPFSSMRSMTWKVSWIAARTSCYRVSMIPLTM